MMDGFLPVETPALEKAPAGRDQAAAPPAWRRWLAPWRPFLLAVVLPTALTGAYYGLFATDQYQSEAHFIIKTNAPGGGGVSGLGQALGLSAPSSDLSETRSVADYLISHDAVAALGRSMDLTAVYQRPEIDLVSRLHGDRPPPESVLKYYRRQVKVTIGSDTGIAALSVRAFRPQDARDMAAKLLELGEARVNTFNQRALENTLGVAKAQLREAEAGMARAQGTLTDFRQDRRDLDPERNGAAQIGLTASLQQQLAQARAQLSSMSASVAPDSPQRVALAAQVKALEAQVGAAQSRMAGARGAIAGDLGAFEGLRTRQQLAAKRYEAAVVGLEQARTEALKQQLFVVRVVEPNLPVKALYPQRLKIVATVFFALALAYAIGWLILAGVREHAS